MTQMVFKELVLVVVIALSNGCSSQRLQFKDGDKCSFEVDINYRNPVIAFSLAPDSLYSSVNHVLVNKEYELTYVFLNGTANGKWLLKFNSIILMEWEFKDNVPIITVLNDDTGQIIRKIIRNELAEVIYSEGYKDNFLIEFEVTSQKEKYSVNYTDGIKSVRIESQNTLRLEKYDVNNNLYWSQKELKLCTFSASRFSF